MKRIIISITAGLFALLCLVLFDIYPKPWFFLSVLLVWLITLVSLTAFTRGKCTEFINIISLIVFSIFSVSGLISLLEVVFLKYFLMVIGFFIFFFIFMYHLRGESGALSYKEKPYRRVLLMLWLFNIYSITSFGFALNVFFPAIPFWIIIVLVSVIIGYISMINWQMYFNLPINKFFLRGILIALIVCELMWVLHLLPLGYLVLGAMVSWVWYLAQLFIRFDLGRKSIIWHKQIVFLISNFILYFLILYFFVRWI